MPYEKRENIRTPSDDTKVWRYVDYPSFTWVFLNSNLHFHRADSFSDEFEMTIPRSILEEQKKYVEDSDNAPPWVRHGFVTAHNRRRVFMNCWHMREYESFLMWAQYGASNKSVAIQSTVGKMKQAFEKTDVNIHIGEVRYTNYHSSWEELDESSKGNIRETFEEINRSGTNPVFNTGPNLAFLKRHFFEDEKELRAIGIASHDSGELRKRLDWRLYDSNPGRAMGLNKPLQTGVNIDVNIDTLIENIYIAPEAPKWLSETLKKIIDNNPNSCLTGDQVEPSKIDNIPHEF